MSKLDLTTSHNIVVTVELANVTQRALATIIDLVVVGIYCAIVAIVSIGSSTISNLLMMPVILCYHLLFEYLNEGQSLGKKAIKLKVISLSGDRPALLDLVMRWMFRLIDITGSLGMLACIFVSSSKKKQRIGDILGNTAVVRIQNEDNYISLSSIKNISDKNYTVTYPQIVRYDDKDMLLVKQALTRHQKRATKENKQLILDLYGQITKELKIKLPPGEDKRKFLKTILNDYVILTR